MGHKILDSSTDELKKVEDSSYRIIWYPAFQLPLSFRSLVIAPFLNSLRYGNDLFKLIDKNAYYSAYAKYIELLLQRPKTTVKLAILSDMTVLGWCLLEEKTIHYVWVKKEVRRQGIGKSLLPKEFDTISHITNKGLSIWVSKFPEVKFNPFI